MSKRIRIRLRRMVRSIVTLHGSPRDIALGTAIGVFVAFTPTVGLQMLIAAFIATIFRANRFAAVIPPWITNPFTIPPIFALTYWVGTWFTHGPSAATVYQKLVQVVSSLRQLSFYAFHQQLKEFLKIGVEVYVPMMIGGIIIGLICAAVSYPLTLRAVNRYRLRRDHKRRSRAYHRARARRSEDDTPAGQS